MLEFIEQKITENSNSDFFVSILFEAEKINFNALVNYAKRNKKKSLFWAKPSESYFFFAFDKIHEFSNDRNTLLNEINSIKEIFKSDYSANPDLKIPFVTGGVKFNNGENSVWQDFLFNDWFIPRFVFLKSNEKFFLIVNISPRENAKNVIAEFSAIREIAFNAESGIISTSASQKLEFVSEISAEEWNVKISAALQLIDENTVSKIVISRFIENKLIGNVNYHSLLSRLAENFPFCTIFGFQSKNSFFFGATPETLFSVNHSSLETDALAGSISRGKTIYEDENLANELLTSDKNLREHRKVVEFIITQLEKHAQTIVYRDTPKIRKLRNIQHLWTPIKAQLKENVNLLSLLYDLHPTPAVCGSPKETAFKKIYEIENFERGLFTGVIGWFNFNNIGDFSVAIRSALIKNNSIFSYAGCGIVKGSVAEEEFTETQLKLKPILNLFEDNEY